MKIAELLASAIWCPSKLKNSVTYFLFTISWYIVFTKYLILFLSSHIIYFSSSEIFISSESFISIYYFIVLCSCLLIMTMTIASWFNQRHSFSLFLIFLILLTNFSCIVLSMLGDNNTLIPVIWRFSTVTSKFSLILNLPWSFRFFLLFFSWMLQYF